MGESRTHPHVDMPSEEDLARIAGEKQPAMRDLYLALHGLVLQAVPDVRYAVDCTDAQIGYGARQFGYDGWGMAAVTPYRNWVSIGFLRGSKLDDPDRLLEGGSALVRHVKIRSAEELESRREAIVRLLEEATRVHNG